MNVTAVFRLTDQRVFTFLEVAARNGFPQAPHLAMYFVRGWRLDALKKGDAKDEFLTGNQYDCICMNAEEFILLCRWLISLPADSPALKDFLLAARVFGSQQCEHFFRILPALLQRSQLMICLALIASSMEKWKRSLPLQNGGVRSSTMRLPSPR